MRKKKKIDSTLGDTGSAISVSFKREKSKFLDAMTKTKQTVELMAKKIWRTKRSQTICNFQIKVTFLKLSFHDVNANLKEIEKSLAYGIYWMY